MCNTWTNITSRSRWIASICQRWRNEPMIQSCVLSLPVAVKVCYGKWGDGNYATGKPAKGYRCKSKKSIKRRMLRQIVHLCLWICLKWAARKLFKGSQRKRIEEHVHQSSKQMKRTWRTIQSSEPRFAPIGTDTGTLTIWTSKPFARIETEKLWSWLLLASWSFCLALRSCRQVVTHMPAGSIQWWTQWHENLCLQQTSHRFPCEDIIWQNTVIKYILYIKSCAK